MFESQCIKAKNLGSMMVSVIGAAAAVVLLCCCCSVIGGQKIFEATHQDL